MLDAIELVCEICSERVTAPKSDIQPCPVCGNESLVEED